MRRLAVLCLAIALPASAQDDLRGEAASLFGVLPPAPELPGATPERVRLGAALYIDPRLSASQVISCNSCHNVGMGGVDLQPTSIGHGWRFGGRNAPTTFNAVFHLAQFWDGRAADLVEQAGGPMANPVEMANTPDEVVATLRAIPGYRPLFEAAFPGVAEPVTMASATAAIAAFEATLTTPGSPFDRWLEGEDDALTAQQRRGLRQFVDIGCAACHAGPLLGGAAYMPFGQVETPDARHLPPGDTGRMQVTGDEADRFVFKVPSLRNIALTRPYFHAGSAWTLEEAVEVMAAAQLGLDLGEDEVADIVAFLESLTGEQPRIDYPVLPPSVAATPRPDPGRPLDEAPAGH